MGNVASDSEAGNTDTGSPLVLLPAFVCAAALTIATAVRIKAKNKD